MEFVLIVIALFVVLTVLAAAGADKSGNPPVPSPVLTQSHPLTYPTAEEVRARKEEIFNKEMVRVRTIADAGRPTLIMKLRKGQTYITYAELWNGNKCTDGAFDTAAGLLRKECLDEGIEVIITDPRYGYCDG